MAIFDRLSGKRNPQQDEYGLKEHSQSSSMGAAEVEETIDDELPSVNRRKSGSPLAGKLGYAVIIGAGALMLYLVNSGNEQKVEAAKSLPVTSHLPPLDIPLAVPPSPPPLPEVSGVVPPVEKPIALQSANAQPAPAQPKGPSWLDRRMGGNLVLHTGAGGTSGTGGAGNTVVAKAESGGDAASPLALRLKPTVSPGVSAAVLPDRNYLITKGTSLDCALETALDSTVPGITTCRLTRDIYSDNGHVLLLERGSQLVGEYQGGLTAGQARIFVLWSRVKTPNGVVVSLDSPGADTLGRSGHSGWVDRHFMERFGAAILMSLVKDGLRVAQNENQTEFQIGGGGTDQLAVEILKETAKIPPTLYINQGDHIQIMVARDLDFSSVYALKLEE